MRRGLIFSLFFFFITGLFAQENKTSYNSLLWKITGNGLQQPSYLYGTMHITDKRVFQFSDSLYHFLEVSEGFAAELDMSTIMSRYINEFLNDDEEEDPDINENPVYLTDKLSDKDLSQYKKALEKKYKRPVDKIQISELAEKDESAFDEMLRNGEMPTFMDAYLFDIARKQGKWVGGIEDFEDQMDLFDPVDILARIEATVGKNKADPKSGMEWMISTYLSEDLDAMDLSETIWQGTKDLILIRRNKKMALRIDSMANIRSTFFAIGAAHIPGVEGVVNLLRQKGFTVSPVRSSSRIAPENYTYQYKDLPWNEVYIFDSAYTLQTPGKAEVMDFLKSLPFELKMYFDLGRMRAFFTMGIPVSLDKTVSRDSLIIKISENLLNNASDITQKKIRVGEHEGVEFTLTDEDKAEIRMQIFVLNDFVALNAISAFKKVALTDHDAERFFNSFRVTETKKSGEENKNSRWKLYTYAEEGFEVESPVKLSVRKNIKGEDGWLQDTYQAFDLAGQTYYGLIVSTVQKGFFSSSDSETFEYMSSQFMSSMNATSVKSIHIVRDGYPAYESVASYDEEGEKIWLRVLFVNKGPRRYLLFTTSGNRGDSDNPGEQFFSSFRLFSPPMKNWESSMAPDETFSTWSPGKIVPFYEEDKSNDEIKYFILDPVNQLQITIDKEVFPSYYWVENDSLLFRNRVNNFFSDTDSLIYYTPFREGDIKAVDVLIKLYDTHNRKRMRLYLNGDTLYSVYTFIPDEFLNSDNYQKLFNDFKISYPVKPFDFTVRKPAALLEALKTKDSTAFETASTYLSESSFIADDIPLLQQAMLYLYRDFDSIYYFNTNKTIADLLEKLDSNHTSIRFFRENYPGITRENEYAKPYILGLLSQFKTQESYELLYDLLINQPPDIEETFYFSNGLSDSLELSRILYPGFIKLAGHPGFFDFANDHILMMIDSGVIDRAMLAPYKNEFIKTANRLLLIPRQELTDKSYQYLSLVKLLGILKQAETNQLLKKIVDLGDNELRLQALVALLKNGQQVDSRDIYTLATFDKYRLRLYEELKEMGKEKLFPADYLSQKRLGQSKIYEYAEEDYEPQTIDFVGERIETFMGKRQKFYLYKLWYSYDMDDNIYLGVAGPYSLNSRDMKCEHEVTSIYWDEIFDEKKVDQFLKELIKQAEEWMEEKEEKN